MRIHPHSKVVFIGDSVTDAGRVQPVAEGLFDPLGRGYVTFIDALLTSSLPAAGLRVVNVGTSGNTVLDLAARWEKDVVAQKPDWLSIMIGINDVWRQFDLPRMPETHVPRDVYEKTLTTLAQSTRSRVKGMVLMTPFHIENLVDDAMRKRMTEYADVVRTLAPKVDAVLVDTQLAFDGMLAHMHSSAIAWDRVHPNQSGHMAIARAWLKAVGYAW